MKAPLTTTVSASRMSRQSAASLLDFSDRLNPMLVRELRTGLRSPLFVWSLTAMNLFLSVALWLTMDRHSPLDLKLIFFGAYCLVVCGLLPLRAANALHEELRGGTIDTLMLTRLSGWRITLGKWLAVAAQQALTMVTMLPYLIVRYFAGGLNAPLELAWLVIFLLLGLLSSAVLTGFSWIKFFLVRAAIMLGVTVAAGTFCLEVFAGMVAEENSYFYSSVNYYLLDEIYDSFGGGVFVLVGVGGLHAAFVALDIAASKVSPASENRSMLRRLLGVVAIAIYIGLETGEYFGNSRSRMWWEMDFTGMGGFMAFITALVLILQALVEQPLNIPLVLRPFIRRGIRGKLMGRLLYPGWPSGVVFSFYLLLFVGAAGWMIFSDGVSLFLICKVAAFLLTLPVPLVLYRWFFSGRTEWSLGGYIIIASALGAWTVLLLALSRAVGSSVFLILGLPIPLSGWAWANYFRSVGGYNVWAESVVLATQVTGAFWWVIALRLAFRAFTETDAEENRLNAATGAACMEVPALGHPEKPAEPVR